MNKLRKVQRAEVAVRGHRVFIDAVREAETPETAFKQLVNEIKQAVGRAPMLLLDEKRKEDGRVYETFENPSL